MNFLLLDIIIIYKILKRDVFNEREKLVNGEFR